MLISFYTQSTSAQVVILLSYTLMWFIKNFKWLLLDCDIDFDVALCQHYWQLRSMSSLNSLIGQA